MPHSIASRPMSPGALITGESFLPDAPEQSPHSTRGEDKTDDDSHAEEATGKVTRNDVKLDDLFDDFDCNEDDELLRSESLNSLNEGSPLEAPL